MCASIVAILDAQVLAQIMQPGSNSNLIPIYGQGVDSFLSMRSIQCLVFFVEQSKHA